MERELLRSRDVSMMHAASERALTVAECVQFVSQLIQLPCRDRERDRGGVSSGATVVTTQNSS